MNIWFAGYCDSSVAMASSILYRSVDLSLLLIDVPRSIEEAQGDTTRRIISTKPLQYPYLSLEPKSLKAKANAQAVSLDDLLLQKRLEFALHEVVENRSGMFCLPRSYGQGFPLIDEIQASKRIKIDTDQSRPLMNHDGPYLMARYLEAGNRQHAPTPCLDIERRSKVEKVFESTWHSDTEAILETQEVGDNHQHSSSRATCSDIEDDEEPSSQRRCERIRHDIADSPELRNCSGPFWSDIAKRFRTSKPISGFSFPLAADAERSRMLRARRDRTYRLRYWSSGTSEKGNHECSEVVQPELHFLDEEGSFFYCNPSLVPTTIQAFPSLSSSSARIPPGSTVLYGDIASTLPAFIHCAPKFNLVIIDPPWPNRSARRSKSYGISYGAQEIESLLTSIPLKDHLTDDGMIGIWITNKDAFRDLVIREGGLFEQWGVHIVEEWIWLKITASGEPICAFDGTWRKPWEVVLIGRRGAEDTQVNRRVLVGVPDLHSRKPNLKEVFGTTKLLNNHEDGRGGKECLEIFARNATAGWWAWGNEVLKFQVEECWVKPSTPPQDTVEIDTSKIQGT